MNACMKRDSEKSNAHSIPNIPRRGHRHRSVLRNFFVGMFTILFILLLSLPQSDAFVVPNSIPSTRQDMTTSNNPRTFQFDGKKTIQSLSPSSPRPTRTAMYGIRGFRSWFESQFPDAMITLHHPRQTKNKSKPPPNNNNSTSKKNKHKSQQGHPPAVSSSHDTFHHVMIDVNQLLHVTLRRSRSEGHALTLLIQELDKCTDIAIPTRSVVLAFDGPPAAAKLAAQRRRRFGTVIRSERKRARFEKMIERGIVHVPTDEEEKDYLQKRKGTRAGRNSRGSKRKRSRKDKAEKDEATLKITPGTKFMDKAHDAVLYWAWQRLLNPKGKLANCRIYISPSTVPGEGEVKLLDWLTQAGGGTGYKQRNDRSTMGRMNRKGSLEFDFRKEGKLIKPGESVAIMGGDSDLVLLSLVISPAITHNVFVILPVGPQTSYAISLWETTRTLGRFLGNKFDPSDIMRVRTDLVLLLIMNGNDYLPKLRGSSGFNKLFHTYLRLLKRQLKNKGSPLFLIDPDTLEFNIPFCIDYFEKLASFAPKRLVQPSEMVAYSNSITPLSYLYSMVDAGFLPSPARFVHVPGESSQIDNEVGGHTDSGKNDSSPDSPEGKEEETLRLILGENDEMEREKSRYGNATRYFEFDVLHKVRRPLKKTKQLLANIALEELLGKDYMDLNDYIVGEGVDEEDIGDEGVEDSEDEDNDFQIPEHSSIGYSWEIKLPAASNVHEYLKGLLWNLATYQDGVCATYGYNYGKRMSPTAAEIVRYFKDASDMNLSIGQKELLNEDFVKPLNAGLSCLAALPSQLRDLIPEPYKQLSNDNRIEEIYASCMEEDANVFDLESFRNLCMEALDIESDVKKNNSSIQSDKLRKIRTGETFWTVIRKSNKPLIHPFAPPKPFSDRLSRLKQSSRIQAMHVIASDRPRWLRQEAPMQITEKKLHKNDMDRLMINSLGDKQVLDNVGYRKAFQGATSGLILGEKDNKNKDGQSAIREAFLPIQKVEEVRAKRFNITLPSRAMMLNVDNLNALQCLQQLADVQALLINWSQTSPSLSDYASIDPDSYEEVRLFINKIAEADSLTGKACSDINLIQDRNINLYGKKVMKRHLAAMALDRIFGPEISWKSMTIQKMKAHLLPQILEIDEDKYHDTMKIHNLNIENRTALQCLHELMDARLIMVEWDFVPLTGGSKELSRLSVNKFESPSTALNFAVTETRDIYLTSKSNVKHYLGQVALKRLIGDDWTDKTLKQMKVQLTFS